VVAETQNYRGLFIMKKIVATLIAGLFATAAFAQTPAPAQTTTPDSATPPAVAKAEALGVLDHHQ
jgi:hypothetical protein